VLKTCNTNKLQLKKTNRVSASKAAPPPEAKPCFIPVLFTEVKDLPSFVPQTPLRNYILVIFSSTRMMFPYKTSAYLSLRPSLFKLMFMQAFTKTIEIRKELWIVSKEVIQPYLSDFFNEV